MEMWLIWIIVGLALVFLEIVLPGGIVFFLGFSAVLVGGAIYLGIFDGLVTALTAWCIASLLSMFLLRSFFLKYFEGDSVVQSVDEDLEIVGSLVEVVEDIHPYKDGRVRFRETTWAARSDEAIAFGASARVVRRDGNCLIVQLI